MGKIYRFGAHVSAPMGVFAGCVNRNRVRNAMGDAPKGGLHSISDALRQRVGPPGYGLSTHADRASGCCDAPTKEIDGFGFVHEPLKHASVIEASMLGDHESKLAFMVGEQTFGDRLAEALGEVTPEGRPARARIPRAKLATHLKTSESAIGQVINGVTKAMTAANAAKTADFLKVNWYWLATGEGDRDDITGIEDAKERAALQSLREIEALNRGLFESLVQMITSNAESLRDVNTSQVDPKRVARG